MADVQMVAMLSFVFDDPRWQPKLPTSKGKSQDVKVPGTNITFTRAESPAR